MIRFLAARPPAVPSRGSAPRHRGHVFSPAALVLALCLPVPALAENVTHFTLPNGLEAVVIEDHRAPAVVQMVWYRAGSADEAPGKSGIAHYLEHLMFKGTDTMEPGEFSRAVEANGGSDNAFTSYDYTAYFQRIAADRLDMVMRMEADRMANLVISENDWLTERDVVMEERSQRTDSDPGALFGEHRRAVQYFNHPYAIPIIGWRHEMEALTRADAIDWYDTHYAPNNAILIVAGDVTAAEVQTLAEEHYGPIPPKPGIEPRVRPAEPPQLAERRVEFADPRVAQPYVVRSYLAPERNAGAQEEAAALTILARLLGGNPATSVLGRALTHDAGTGDGPPVAIHASAFYGGVSLDPTTFTVSVVPAAGVTLAEAEAALDAALARFLEQGPDPAQFERIRTQVRADEIYASDNIGGLANRYGAALATGLTVEDVRAWPGILMEVTEDEVMAAAHAVFDRRRAVTGWLMQPEPAPAAHPADEGAVPAPAALPAEAEGEAAPETTP